MVDRIAHEPVLVTALIAAVVTLLIQSGLPIHDGLADALNAVVVAGLALYARSRVSPVE